MTTLPGYQLSKCLYEGTRTEVYRGTRSGDRASVIVKILRNPHPNFSQLVQFRNQYAIARHLSHPNIVSPLALERYGNGYALIMPDSSAIALHDYWQQEAPNIEEFLTLAMQLADALHYLGQEQIIHKDIKPANILIRRETKQVQLIDFSISTLLPKETQTIQTANVLEGTLAYLSPEQTGRMNRGIDYRSDFYALGVTFYELLTGTVPFVSDDPLELIHAHIAKIPEPVSTHQSALTGEPIPKVLSDIVLKLMAKNAEDRYQSALGLKYDLEKCLTQYRETKIIVPFALGEQDRCDRFLIPEKLYGREAEVSTLLAAFERVTGLPRNSRNSLHPTPYTLHPTSEMVLVAGYSGIGKTAIINEVHKPIVRQKGYFIKGKFDQFNRNIPFSAFVQAFRDLMGQLLGESDAELQRWKGQILEAVGQNGRVLIEVIPELERIIGQQPPVPELSGSAAQNRFNLLFEKFIAVFTTKEHPLTLFLDDLQWADSASLNLMKVLMGDSRTGYLLLLGAYRDNEVFPAHPLMLTLADLEKRCDPAPVSDPSERVPREQRTTISTITLEPLSVGHVNQLVAETLSCTLEVATPLTDLVYEKTKGNPFFTTQFLKGLYEDGLITFEGHLGYWQCDLVRVRDAALTDDVVEFMARRLHKLPSATQEVLKLAACIGNQFDLETLAIICENPSEEVAADLWRALQEGLVLPQTQAYKFFQRWEKEEENAVGITVEYRFLHDRIQQAAYYLIPEEEKQKTHYHIGQLLLEKFSAREQEERLFEIVNHLNIGIPLISQAQEREDLAKLNLKAGQKAKTATAYSAAIELFNVGIELLGGNGVNSWQEYYELSLELHSEIAEASYLNTNFEEMEQWVDVVLQHAQTLLDTIKVQQTRIMGTKAQGKLVDSIEIGLQLLKELGIELEPQPTQEDVGKAYQASRRLWTDKPPQSFINLPIMSDPNLLAAMNLLAVLVPAAYVVSPNLMLLVIFKQVELSMRSGNTPKSIFAYSEYGLVLSGIMGDISNGYEFGDLALSLLEKFQAKSFKSRCWYVVYAYIKHYKNALSDIIPKLETAYDVSLETGDLETLGWSAFGCCVYSYHQGQNLAQVLEKMEAYRQTIIQYKLAFCLPFKEIYQQTVLNLLGKAEIPYSLTGEIFHKEKSIPQLQATNQRTALFLFFLNQSILDYMFGKNHKAIQTSAQAAEYLDGGTGMFMVPLYFYFDALIQLAQCSQIPPSERPSILLKVQQNQEKLHQWATLSPMNHQHRWELVEAERCRAIGNKTDAMDAYDKAISGAKENGYSQEEALANELAAKFYLDWGKEKIAAVYMTDAYYGYARWGAKAKIDDLEQRYPKLLKAILQQTDTKTRSGMSLSNAQTDTSSISNISSLVDFSSLLKAGRSLSQEIDLERAIAQFMEVIQENAGAHTTALMLFQEDTLMLTAHATGEKISLIHIPVETSNNVPKTLINQVKNRREHLVLDNAKEHKDYNRDNYIQQHQPQSVLCMPLIDRGQLRGILYLENNQTSGAFTSDRIEILNLLCSQAAISLENAQLYNNLEIKVQARTAELSQAVQNLKDTQKQLVESEKMASLGSLVAGVAHEINTPVGTCITVASTLNEETQAFASAIANGQLKRSVLNNYIETCTECTQLIGSNLKRAGELIGSFKQVAVDRTHLEMRTFAIKPYLEEVLTSLMPNIRQQGHVVKVTGDENLQLTTYPGALAQIVTNLTNNSLVHGYPDGQTGQLNWRIELKEDKLIIEYEDDGCGIGVAELEKIFEPFYTTARNQGGTGLGLHIVYNLVTQKLLGRIWAESQPSEGVKFTLSIPK